MGTNLKSRRHFFLRGGAAPGVAAAAGATSLAPAASPDDAQRNAAADREAIRQLHISFMSRMEAHAYEAAAELFAEQAELHLGEISARGSAIRTMLAEQYRQQRAASLHSAYRPNSAQEQDVVMVGADQQHAHALYHVDVRITSPLHGDSTLVQMARLQGQMAVLRWESGHIEASYVKTSGEWKTASLRCLAS